MVLKNVEGDTVKQLQLIDGKTRTVFFLTDSFLKNIRAFNKIFIQDAR